MRIQVSVIVVVFLLSAISVDHSIAETGYKTWLRYQKVENTNLLSQYSKFCRTIFSTDDNEIIHSAINEFKAGFKGMLGITPRITSHEIADGLIIGTKGRLPFGINIPDDQYDSIDQEGFIIASKGKNIVITAKSDMGLLYGAFHLLRLMQMNEPVSNLSICENPKIKLRLLSHWDNPGRIPPGRPSIERVYAGESIFKWEELPEINTRYIDYARMLASVGINGTVINNVNTAGKGLEGWKLLTREYLPKLKALAAVFRDYGIKLYISVNFFSPVLIAGLQNADPLNPEVQEWWKNKVAEIYSEIPDFGGFLIKADSEGQPGPITYGRNHAEGANLLANALKPYGGLLIWRAFVYGKDMKLNPDRAFQAYEIFKPLDGQFADNALVQVKNGPIDFQIREPVSPLFGAMPKSNQVLELQITQEYTGQNRHVCYLVPQWKEVFQFDTYAEGPNSTVTKIINGSLFDYQYSGVAGVANIGSDLNWTGHHLAQANFYGYGRLAWNPDLSSEQITREWIIQTFNQNKRVVSVISDILFNSWKTYENYTSPLGVGVMCGGDRGSDGHFYPAPAAREAYHHANTQGVGYDRTMTTGSGYTSQYAEPNRSMYEDLHTCPDELLLFFHHVPYAHVLKSGKTVIQHIYDSHNDGVEQVKYYLKQWQSLRGFIDDERFGQVSNKLKQQVGFAEEWRDSINTYFYKLSGIEDSRQISLQKR